MERRDNKDLRALQYHVETTRQMVEMMRTNFRFMKERVMIRTGLYEGLEAMLTVGMVGVVLGMVGVSVWQVRSFKRELTKKKII